MRKILNNYYLLNLGIIIFAQLTFMRAANAQSDNSFDAYPKVGIGINQLSFVRLDGTELNANYTTLNMGLSLVFGKLSFDVSGELFGIDFLENQGEITGIERQDYTLTTGYSLSQKSIMFFGYTQGETKDDFQGEFHDDKGYFIGAGYGFVINELNYDMTLSYANLDGSIIVDGDPASNTTGKTSGFSYGISTSGPFRETMAYTVALKVRQYEYSVDGSSAVTDKRVTSLTLALIF